MIILLLVYGSWWLVIGCWLLGVSGWLSVVVALMVGFVVFLVVVDINPIRPGGRGH